MSQQSDERDDEPGAPIPEDEDFLLPPREPEEETNEPLLAERLRRGGLRAGALLLLPCALVGGAGLGYLSYLAGQLPKIEKLADYRPNVVSQVYDATGTKIWEFYKEKRIVLPLEQIPERVRHAFVAAEDAGFYRHSGVDFTGILRATVANLKAGSIKQGASTITQQVARSFFLTPERKVIRKLKEVILARRIERHLSKDDILALYLNQIYLGAGAYGVASAAEVYFHKTLGELSLAETATIAGVTPRPAAYAPNVNPEAAARRKSYVLGQMLSEQFITKEDYDRAVAEEVRALPRVLPPEAWPHMAYAMEQLRLELIDRLGEESLFRDGLHIVTSLVDADQQAATAAVRAGIERLDQRLGYRGPLRQMETEDERLSWLEEAAGRQATAAEAAGGGPPFALGAIVEALVTGYGERRSEAAGQGPEPTAELLLAPGAEGFIRLSTLKWARPPDPDVKPELGEIEHPRQAMGPGDIVEARVLTTERTEEPSPPTAPATPAQGKAGPGGAPLPPPAPRYRYELSLHQKPEVQGALLSLDPRTGRVRAMVGGYDFAQSAFNRSVQAVRQPGSAFKPIIFSRALTKGYTPSTVILDAPVTYQGVTDDEVWKPKNYVDRFTGKVTLREALTRSINTIPVKILMDIGIAPTIEYARQLGIGGELAADPTLALGSSSVTLWDLSRAYAVFANEGFRINASLVEHVRDAQGEVRYERSDRWSQPQVPALPPPAPPPRWVKHALPDTFGGPSATTLAAFGPFDVSLPAQAGPADPDARAERIQRVSDVEREAGRVLSAATAYVMTNLLSNVILHGTGHQAVAIHRPAAGKTGTSNENIDNWFLGYTPHLLTGVWLGYDDRRTLGRFNAGGNTAAPTWLDFMQVALAGTPVERFEVPEGVVFTKIDAETGLLARPDTRHVVFQAFIEGTEPTEFTPRKGEVRVQDFFHIDESLREQEEATEPDDETPAEAGDDEAPDTADIMALP